MATWTITAQAENEFSINSENDVITIIINSNAFGEADISDIAETIAESVVSKLYRNIIVVDDVFGNNETGDKEKNKPFKTITAAKNAAINGDIIVVYPGTYNEYDLAKDGITYYFIPGAIVYYSGSVNNACIFSDNNQSINFKVYGFGNFLNYGSGGSSDVIKCQSNGSVFKIQCLNIIANYNRAVANYGGNIEVNCENIQSEDGSIDSVGGNLGYAITKIKARTITSNENYAIEYDGGIVEIDCDEITVINASFAAIAMASPGSANDYVRVNCNKLIAAGYGVEALASTKLYLNGIQFFTENDNFAEGTSNYVYIENCSNGLTKAALTGDVELLNYPAYNPAYKKEIVSAADYAADDILHLKHNVISIFDAALVSSNDFIIGLPTPVLGTANECIFIFKIGATLPAINAPVGIVWRGKSPLPLTVNSTYTIAFEQVSYNGTSWEIYGTAIKNV